MARIIYTESPGKTRHHYRRSVAEMLRRLSQKRRIDDEAKDQAALIVLCLQGMADTVDQTITAWEKRDYWMKAERFRREWEWLDPMADRLAGVIGREDWHELPALLAALAPHFSDIAVKRLTRAEALWTGAYQRLMQG
ncbi:MAG: hypothetical protein U9R72_13470 [Chloroflexota bacterium]|nr:hypothetical protein [Chloroflexota bacterium]